MTKEHCDNCDALVVWAPSRDVSIIHGFQCCLTLSISKHGRVAILCDACLLDAARHYVAALTLPEPARA